MILSKRERYLFIGALVAAGLLGLYWKVLTPLLDQRSETQDQILELRTKVARAQTLIVRHRQLALSWKDMVRTGLKSDPGEAEGQVYRALGEWAEESGVSLPTIQGIRLTTRSRLPEIAFQASGTGTMSGIAHLVWRIQTATFPIKITEMHISAPKDGVDDLAITLHLSTIHTSPQPATAPASVARSTPGGA